jgi:hypothetical protein
VSRAAESIQIIHETKPETSPFKQAHRLLGQAARICFLGFGFDETNLRRLLDSPLTNTRASVSGSAMGFTNRQMAIVNATFVNLGFAGGVLLDNQNGEVSDFLAHHCPFD